MSDRGKISFSGAIALVLFLTLAAYLAAGIGGRLSREMRWESVSARKVESFFTAEGIIIRREITGVKGYAEEGQRLGSGDSMGEGFFAPASGIYFSQSDAFAYLSPEDIPKLDAEQLSRLCSEEPIGLAEGRLITGNDWYFVFLLPRSIELAQGSALMLDLGMGELPCLVQSSEKGLVVLRMDTQLALHASLRIGEAKIIKESFSGLALPASALHRSGGDYYVWAITAGRLEKKKIEIIFFGEDFVLAEAAANAAALQEGDRVITEGDELYEGKIII